MQVPNYNYLVTLIEEQRLKQLAIDELVQLEMLGLSETELTKAMRRRYMEYLANRILQIQQLLNAWLSDVKLPLDLIVE